MNDQAQRRQHYRIQYPISSRPKLHFNKEVFEILDLSEKGIRFMAKPTPSWAKAKLSLSAEIEFVDKQKFKISGSILRITADQIIVQLTQGIPYAKILDEQRKLLKKHGSIG